ncbi:MAG TPA: ATP synthase F1 subunit delta [Longimicrobiaceae bacterium]|nr:ATP synthase F1 subunit delta [Longimicrobiaceae bacterium]
MRAEAIARNYAETLLALAQRHGGQATAEEYQWALEDLAALLESEPRVREFLETPRVTGAQKREALRATLAGRVPDLFLRFVLVVLDKRRQTLFREIAAAYRDLMDEMLGRVRVHVALSHAPDASLQQEIQRGLEARLGKTVIADYTVDAELLGGIVVRVGDQILDGSIRSRAAGLRRRLMEAEIPAAVG